MIFRAEGLRATCHPVLVRPVPGLYALSGRFLFETPGGMGEILRARGIASPPAGPLDLAVAAGECLTVHGPSGCGKTRFLRALADLDPHRGRAWLEGREREEFPPARWRAGVAYVAAEPAWWAAIPRDHFPAGFDEGFATALGLEADRLDLAVERCSTGERQRLALWRALARRPRVLLLDEPTANLDVDTAALVVDAVRAWLEEHRAAAVWVCHDPATRERIGGSVLAMDAPGATA